MANNNVKPTPPDDSVSTPHPFVLVAQDTFREFKRGDIISDPKIIAEILDTHHESFVTKVATTIV